MCAMVRCASWHALHGVSGPALPHCLPSTPTSQPPQVHARNKKFDDDIDLKEIALRTPGFSGASGGGWGAPLVLWAGRHALQRCCACFEAGCTCLCAKLRSTAVTRCC